MDCAEESTRRRELYFLRRLEPALRGSPLLDDCDGFLARPPDRQSQKSTVKTPLAGRERLHEPQHAGVFQIREFSPGKLPVVAGARRRDLSTASSRYPAAGRHFLLYVPLPLLHARHLSRRPATHAIAPRFRPRRFVFPATRRRPDCPGGRFSAAACLRSASEDRTIFLGPCAYDAGSV